MYCFILFGEKRDFYGEFSFWKMVIVQLAMLVYCRVQYPLSFKAPVRIVSELLNHKCMTNCLRFWKVYLQIFFSIIPLKQAEVY